MTVVDPLLLSVWSHYAVNSHHLWWLHSWKNPTNGKTMMYKAKTLWGRMGSGETRYKIGGGGEMMFNGMMLWLKVVTVIWWHMHGEGQDWRLHKERTQLLCALVCVIIQLPVWCQFQACLIKGRLGVVSSPSPSVMFFKRSGYFLPASDHSMPILLSSSCCVDPICFSEFSNYRLLTWELHIPCIITWPSPSLHHHWLTTLTVIHLPATHTWLLLSFQGKSPDYLRNFHTQWDTGLNTSPDTLSTFLDKRNGKVHPVTGHEGMRVGGQCHALAAVPPGKTQYHCIGGWVGLMAGLDGCRISAPPPHRDTIPRPSSP
jgi:hypothetical protein